MTYGVGRCAPMVTAATGPARATALASPNWAARPAGVTVTRTVMSRPSSVQEPSCPPLARTSTAARSQAAARPSTACRAPANAPRSAAACAWW